MKFTMAVRLISVVALAGLATAPSVKANPRRSFDGFEIKREPGKGDWRYFIKAPEAAREQLWAYQANHGKHLKDWAWGWRLGWVRVCGVSDRAYCRGILNEALGDRALVVRAEAATRIGQLYEKSGSDQVIGVLATAYRNPRNVRHGHPLYIQSRILFALRQIGGDHAMATAAQLAAALPETQAYWTRLQSSDHVAAEAPPDGED
jgi:hypothetical protein